MCNNNDANVNDKDSNKKLKLKKKKTVITYITAVNKQIIKCYGTPKEWLKIQNKQNKIK